MINTSLCMRLTDLWRLVVAVAVVALSVPTVHAQLRISELIRWKDYQSPNNGKQVAELSDGRHLVLVHSTMAEFPTISLWRSQSATPVRFADFERVAELVGPKGSLEGAGPCGYGGCLVVIGNRLHLGWTVPGGLGIEYSIGEIQGEEISWSPVKTIVEGDARLGDLVSVGGSIVLTWQQTHNKSDASVGLARLDGQTWRVREVHRGVAMSAPVADVDQHGELHLAWFTPAEELFHARLTELSAEPVVERAGYGAAPSILCLDDGQLLIACEDQYGFAQSYLFEGKGWSGPKRFTISHPWLTFDQLHSPQLSKDRHGVVWMFWCDNTRRSVFWSRWLGDGWSEPYNGPRVYYATPRFDANLLAVGRLAVQKRSRPGSPDIGMLLITERPGEVVEYRREIVPDLKTARGRKVLFFDLLEFSQTKGIELEVEQAVKHPANPLMQRGPKGMFDQDRVFNHGRVMFDGGRYRMWYGGIREPRAGDTPRLPWWDWIHCGYAESDDGVHWQRVRVGLAEWKGSKENNIVPDLRHVPLVIKDEGDPDASRRYKAFYFWNSGEHLEMARSDKYGRRYDPREKMFHMDLFVSPDGLHFTRVPGEVRFSDEQVKPYSTIAQSVFRDEDEPDPRKRYKAHGFMSLNLRRRGTCYLTSPDCMHWTAHAEIPVIDPAVRGMPPAVGGNTGQVHDTVVLPYEGYYVALYQDQHDPENMPVELAMSRDAETFRHVKVGSKVIPVGAAGEWDALTILPTIPIVLEKEIRLYYGGGREAISDDGYKRMDVRPGLATLRRDGFTAVRLTGGAGEGWLETIPFALPEGRHKLRINAACPVGTEIRVAVIDAESGHEIQEYASGQCEALQGDSLEATIRWKAGQTLPLGVRLVRLRFELKGTDKTPSLYAFRLIEV